MKLCAVLVCVAALCGVPSGYALAADEKREPAPRFKGVEVYSWKDGKGEWRFAVLNGTNREKTEQEVKGAAAVYTGVTAFISALRLLAEGEMVFWGHRIKGFEFPPAADIKKIEEAAKVAKIKLERLDR